MCKEANLFSNPIFWHIIKSIDLDTFEPLGWNLVLICWLWLDSLNWFYFIYLSSKIFLWFEKEKKNWCTREEKRTRFQCVKCVNCQSYQFWYFWFLVLVRLSMSNSSTTNNKNQRVIDMIFICFLQKIFEESVKSDYEKVGYIWQKKVKENTI